MVNQSYVKRMSAGMSKTAVQKYNLNNFSWYWGTWDVGSRCEHHPNWPGYVQSKYSASTQSCYIDVHSSIICNSEKCRNHPNGHQWMNG